jgi:hypothetical protein
MEPTTSVFIEGLLELEVLALAAADEREFSSMILEEGIHRQRACGNPPVDERSAFR